MIINVEHNGEGVQLNSRLLARQGITDPAPILALHLEKLKLFEKVTNGNLHPAEAVRPYADLENALQEAWGFGANGNYHRWWELPGCTCPKIDNLEVVGCDISYYNMECKAHGRGTNIREQS